MNINSARYADPRHGGTSWDLNGELVVRTEPLDGEVMVAVVAVRDPRWQEAAHELLRATARNRGILRRVGGTIDGAHVVVEPGPVDALIAAVAQHRFASRDYAALTELDAQRAILRHIADAGGSLRWDLVPIDQLEIEHFPLGYRFRDAMDALQKTGAFDIVRTKGAPPTLRLNARSQQMLASHDGPAATDA